MHDVTPMWFAPAHSRELIELPGRGGLDPIAYVSSLQV
jgi:hypothetical protein